MTLNREALKNWCVSYRPPTWLVFLSTRKNLTRFTTESASSFVTCAVWVSDRRRKKKQLGSHVTGEGVILAHRVRRALKHALWSDTSLSCDNQRRTFVSVRSEGISSTLPDNNRGFPFNSGCAEGFVVVVLIIR